MALKEICIDCLCIQLYAIRESAQNPRKVVELVNELLAEYDETPNTAFTGLAPTAPQENSVTNGASQ